MQFLKNQSLICIHTTKIENTQTVSIMHEPFLVFLVQLKITAKDKGSVPNSASAELVYILLNDRNTNPAFAQRLMTVHMLENCSQSPSTLFDPAIDEDKENGNCFDFNPNYCEIFYILSGNFVNLVKEKKMEMN